jgi:hypothetical protein
VVGRFAEGVPQDLLRVAVPPRLLQNLREDVHGIHVVGLHREGTLAKLRRILKPSTGLHSDRRFQKLLYL